MSNKAETEKRKLIQEKCQTILAEFLRDEDNKYCVDCDAKGPRWASWNLGIFLCIRCAGIHRNLGVHISKVKSVNLDAWTPEQIGSIQQMGNSKARAVYEANLPDNFRRPQTDSALEAFIRAKYEQKKYIAKEWVPTDPTPAFDIEEELRKEKERKRNKAKQPQQNSGNLDVREVANSLPRPHSSPAGTIINADKVPQDTSSKKPDMTANTSAVDLLGLDLGSNSAATVAAASSNQDDPFDAFVSAAPIASNDSANVNSKAATKTDKDEESDFFNQKVEEKKVLSKESILSLYGSMNSAPSPSLMTTAAIPPQTNLVGSSSQLLGNVQQQLPFGNQPLLAGTQFGAPVSQGIGSSPLQVLPGHGQQPQQLPQNVFMPPISANPSIANVTQSAFSVTTNPFLVNSPAINMAQPPVSKLNQQFGSLQLGTNVSSGNMPVTSWATVPASTATSVPMPPQGLINPFMTSQPIFAGAPTTSPFGAGANLFATQTDLSSINSQSWSLGSQPVPAGTAPGLHTTNIWQ